MAFINSICPSNRLSSTSFLSDNKCKFNIPKWVVPLSKRVAIMSSSTAVEKGGGMRIIPQADEATISKLGCRSWATWGCGPSTFPWSYSDDEVCLVLEGDFTVIPDGGGESMEVKAGDIAFFPKDMSCTWEVRKAVQKHFIFGLKI